MRVLASLLLPICFAVRPEAAEIRDQAVSGTDYLPYQYPGNLPNDEHPHYYVAVDGTLYPGEYQHLNVYAEPYRFHDSNSYRNGYRSRTGENGESGYDTAEEFAKKSSGSHEKTRVQGESGEKGADKVSYSDESGASNSQHSSEKDFEAGKSSQASDRKKGSKTTGYRKRYSKDEYKKKHTSYDRADKKGSFDKYGDFDSYRRAKSGAREAAEVGSSGDRQGYYKEAGASDKGRYESQDGRRDALKGRSQYYEDRADYASRGGTDRRKATSFAE